MKQPVMYSYRLYKDKAYGHTETRYDILPTYHAGCGGARSDEGGILKTRYEIPYSL